MRLTLTAGIEASKALSPDTPLVGGEMLCIDGVTYLDQGYSFRIGFRDTETMLRASHMTGWPQLGEDLPILDTGVTQGNGKLVLVAKGIAYHAFTLDVEPALTPFITLDADFNVPLVQHGGPVRSGVNTEGFTNGPWHVEALEGNPDALAICTGGGNGWVIAEIHREDDGLHQADYADAAMLAAAPDMRKQLHRANDLIAEALAAFEDEEDSVKEEHADLIDQLREYHK